MSEEASRPPRPPELAAEERRAIRDFWEVYEANHEQLWQLLVERAQKYGYPPEDLRKQADQSRRLRRRAVLDNDWGPYMEYLRAMGSAYARGNVTFSVWFDFVGSFRAAVLPLLFDAYRSTPQRLQAAINGMNRFTEIVMSVIGEHYVSSKEEIIRKQEEGLRAGEERYRDLFDNAGDILYTHDLDGKITSINKAGERLTGHSREEAMGMNIAQVVAPEDRELAMRMTRGKLEKDETTRYELEMLSRDGRRIPIEVSTRLVFQDGRPAGVQGIGRDISERRRSDRRLAAQHAVARILAESATLEEATPLILRAIGEVLVWEIGELWRVDPQANVIRLVECWHAPAVQAPGFEEFSRRAAFPPGVGIPGRVWAGGEPLWVPDVAVDPMPRGPIAAREGLHAAIAFPIRVAGRVQGVVMFFSAEIRPPDNELLEILGSVGNQIAQFFERTSAVEEIRRQQEAIRRLSTPVLQVRRQLLILPIIGEIDAERAQQLTTQLLAAIRAQRARAVVIDFTGVASVNEAVANHLVRTVEASRLLGATVIVAGLSRDLAYTLVEIGVDLTKLNIAGDLQGGIEQAETLIRSAESHGAYAPRGGVRSSE